MQHYKRLVTLFCIFFPLQLLAQDIAGLWKGTLYNDTTQKTLKYEIAISKEGKKFTGYSYTFFIYEDKVYQGLKKVKIKQQDNKIIIEDDGLISNNYPVAPNKGVRQLNVLTLTVGDSIMTLSGPFSTNRTKEYHSLTGSISVQRKSDFKQSAIIPHLEELGLAKNLSFLQEDETYTIAAAKNNKTDIVKTENVKKETDKNIKQSKTPTVKSDNINIATPIVNTAPAADLANRKIETIQSVYFKSDSLEITLYDNGEIDGDTVSVIMNGIVIMPKVGLSTSAVRKKISTKNIGDSIQLIMYAETLGSLPPNTGLLIVYDGNERYEIRFSGDMQKSSAIVFKRKQ